MPVMVRPKGKPTDIALNILGRTKKKKDKNKGKAQAVTAEEAQ